MHRPTQPLRPLPKRVSRIRELAIITAIGAPLAGLAVLLIVPADELFPTGATATVSASATVPSAVAVSIPPTVTLPHGTTTLTTVTPCQRGTCVALRPVEMQVDDGSEVLVQPGDTVTDARADGSTTRPYLEFTYNGFHGTAYVTDPDGGLLFRAADR
jgi:hypothetical protein